MNEQPVIETSIYRLRFSEEELRQAREIWRRIAGYLQPYVPAGGTTLDLGAGYCHFINNIASAHKIALDINEENLRLHAHRDVRCITASGAAIEGVASGSVDTAFASNVYEHFPSREDVASSFSEIFRVLKPGGRFIILQPNFPYCMREYFDFFDHRLIFTHLGMAEGLEISGFAIERLTAQFLPYTTKSRIPKAPWLVSLYLRVPLAWKILGAQMLIVARKPA